MSLLDIFIFFPVFFMFIFSRSRKENIYFDRDSTATLRGIAMIWIIVHHIQGQSAFGGSPLLTHIGYLATGLFFFISGYGNTFSLDKTPTIQLGWLFLKLKKIYVPFFFIYFLCFFEILFYRQDSTPSLKSIIIDLFTVSLPNQTTWFPKIILLCFILHWISKKIFAKSTPEVSVIALSIALCFYVLVMIFLSIDGYWYNSVFCYAFGTITAIKKGFILKISDTKRKKYSILICLFVAFLIVFLSTKHINYLQILSAVLFSFLCFSYTTIFSIKTHFLAWIGNNSFEFFLTHIACLGILKSLVTTSKYLYAFAVIAESIIIVLVYVNIKKLIKGR